jgi:hypothetical protein
MLDKPIRYVFKWSTSAGMTNLSSKEPPAARAGNRIPDRPKSLLLLPLERAVARVFNYLDKEPYYDGRFNACDPG